MLWPHPYQLIATSHMRTEEMTLNDEAKKLVQQRPNLPFAWRPSQYEGIKTATAGEKPGCWIQYTGELNFDNFGASLTDSFVFCIVAG